VKTQDLSMLVSPYYDEFVHCYFSGGVILENLFQNLVVATTGGVIVVVRHYLLQRGVYFYFISSLMSSFVLDIMLLQRMGVLVSSWY
jgi:hypothetical protein